MRLISNARIGGFVENQEVLRGKGVIMVMHSDIFAAGKAVFIYVPALDADDAVLRKGPLLENEEGKRRIEWLG